MSFTSGVTPPTGPRGSGFYRPTRRGKKKEPKKTTPEQNTAPQTEQELVPQLQLQHPVPQRPIPKHIQAQIQHVNTLTSNSRGGRISHRVEGPPQKRMLNLDRYVAEMEDLSKILGGHPLPSVLHPEIQATELSYKNAINAIRTKTGPMIDKLKTLPERTFMTIFYDTHGSCLLMHNDLVLNSDVSITYLVTWLQMILDTWIVKYNHKESLLVESIKIRWGATEINEHLPSLKGEPWFQDVSTGRGADRVMWEVGGSELEVYWDIYRCMMLLLFEDEDGMKIPPPILKVKTCLALTKQGTVGRDYEKEHGLGHYFKAVNRVTDPKQYFEERGESISILQDMVLEDFTKAIRAAHQNSALDLQTPTATSATIEDQRQQIHAGGASMEEMNSLASKKYVLDLFPINVNRAHATTPEPRAAIRVRSENLNVDTSAAKGQRVSIFSSPIPQEGSEQNAAATEPPSKGRSGSTKKTDEPLFSKQKPGETQSFVGDDGKKYEIWVPWRPQYTTHPTENWGYWQRKGGDPARHKAFPLDHCPYEKSSFSLADLAGSGKRVVLDVSAGKEPSTSTQYEDKFVTIIDEEKDLSKSTGILSKGKEVHKGFSDAPWRNMHQERFEAAIGFDEADDDIFYPKDSPQPVAVKDAKKMEHQNQQHNNSGMYGDQGDQVPVQPNPILKANPIFSRAQSRFDFGSPFVAEPTAARTPTMNAAAPSFQRSGSSMSNLSATFGSKLNVNAPSFESPSVGSKNTITSGPLPFQFGNATSSSNTSTIIAPTFHAPPDKPNFQMASRPVSAASSGRFNPSVNSFRAPTSHSTPEKDMAQYQEYVRAGSRTRSQSPLKPLSSSRPSTHMGISDSRYPFHGVKAPAYGMGYQQSQNASAQTSFGNQYNSSAQMGNTMDPRTWNQGAGIGASLGPQTQFGQSPSVYQQPQVQFQQTFQAQAQHLNHIRNVHPSNIASNAATATGIAQSYGLDPYDQGINMQYPGTQQGHTQQVGTQHAVIQHGPGNGTGNRSTYDEYGYPFRYRDQNAL